jgi:hypothetical protein
MKSFCIIPCGSKKIWDIDPNAGPTPAKQVYVGPFAGKCREYAERFYPGAWCILSAKYGFLLPDDIVAAPYNVTFNDRMTNPISAERLSAQAEEKGLHEYDEVIVLGGRNYVSLVRDAFAGANIRAPLTGSPGSRSTAPGCYWDRLLGSITFLQAMYTSCTQRPALSR